jgi:hypothetical protein
MLALAVGGVEPRERLTDLADADLTLSRPAAPDFFEILRLDHLVPRCSLRRAAPPNSLI